MPLLLTDPKGLEAIGIDCPISCEKDHKVAFQIVCPEIGTMNFQC